MRIAIFSVTPYQILLATHLVTTILKEYEVDLYVINHFDKTFEITKKLEKEENLFKEIRYVDGKDFLKKISSDSKLQKNLRIIDFFHRYKDTAETYFKFNSIVYDEVYFSWPDIIVKIAVKYLHSINPSLKINQLEDGFNSYSDKFRKKNWKSKVLDILTDNIKIEKEFNDLYLFKPELYDGKISKKHIKMIPPISTKSDHHLNILNRAFGYQKQHSIFEKVILLDHLNTQLDTAEWLKIIDLINSKINNKFIVKLHPGAESSKYSNDIKIYSNHTVPWEIVALNNDINNKVLISFFTHAQISNKTLFDAEPYLIYLYDMAELKQYYHLAEEFIALSKQVTSLYRDSSRVFFPKNIEELENILEYLKDKI